jgi:hypothetical protein
VPWKSKAQERWGNSPSGHAALGTAGVNEWNQATGKGAKLPERKRKKPSLEHKVAKKIKKAFPND